MQAYFSKHKLGQKGQLVEIDESKFTHYSKGGQDAKVWVLGFYERGSKDIRAFVMKDRTEVTCTQMIRDHVVEGAEVLTDFWRGYNTCKEFYTHRTVNKAKYGSGQGEYMTTSRVESLWHSVKRIIRNYSSLKYLTLQRFLDEAVWRIKYKDYEEREQFLIQLLQVKQCI
jgi:transposase-like protein